MTRDIYFGLRFSAEAPSMTYKECQKAVKDWEVWWENINSIFGDVRNEMYEIYQKQAQEQIREFKKQMSA